jgi:hypothetical protein
MPVKYVCKHCGFVLWEFKEVGQDYYGIPTPEEVIRVYGGICPRCKHDLTLPSLNDITIEPATRKHNYVLLSNIEKVLSKKALPPINTSITNKSFMAAQEI